jgi:hypothetical protein
LAEIDGKKGYFWWKGMGEMEIRGLVAREGWGMEEGISWGNQNFDWVILLETRYITLTY